MAGGGAPRPGSADPWSTDWETEPGEGGARSASRETRPRVLGGERGGVALSVAAWSPAPVLENRAAAGAAAARQPPARAGGR